MTTTTTQQSEALRLADTLDQVSTLFSFPAALLLSAAELRHQHTEIARLTAENEALKASVYDAVAAEREACAVVCESLFVPEQVLGAHPDYIDGKNMAKSQCSAAIRARGTQ